MARSPAAFSTAKTKRLRTSSAAQDMASGSSGIQNALLKMLCTTTPLPKSKPYLPTTALYHRHASTNVS